MLGQDRALRASTQLASISSTPMNHPVHLILTGIHLMCTGVVNANLVELNEEARLPYIADLIARKQSGCLRMATAPRSKTPTGLS